MSIRLRLNLLFLAASAVALGLGVYGLRTIGTANRAVELAGRRQERMAEAHAIQVSFLEGASSVRAFVHGDNDALDRANTINHEVEPRLLALERSAESDEERQVVQGLSRSLGGFQRTVERALFCRKKNQDDLARPLVAYLDSTLLPQVSEEVQRLVENSRSLSHSSESRARERLRGTIAVVATAFVALGVGAITLLVILRRWLVRPLEDLAEGARRISRGEYDAPVEQAGSSELAALSHELASMGRSIEAYQRELLEKERLAALGEMTHAVAHNVRNPLASIRALAQSTERSMEAGSRNHGGMVVDPDTIRSTFRSIMKSVDGLDRWLKDLLVSQRPIKLSKSTIDLNQVVREVAESMGTYAGQREVSIVVAHSQAACEAVADRRRLDQALISVVSNAIEASPPGSRVHLSSFPGSEPRGNIEIVVEDHGVGIDLSDQKKIFTPYYSTKQGGTGLGLSLARKIVVSHDGRLEVDSTPGRGSRFRLVLPNSVSETNATYGSDTDRR